MKSDHHDWRGGSSRQWCGNLGCTWQRTAGIDTARQRTRWLYRNGADGPEAPARKTMPKCHGKAKS